VSPPATPGIPERFLRDPERTSIHDRLAGVERQTAEIPQLVLEVGEIKKYLANVKALENVVRHIIGKGILLIVGAVGSTWGVTKATESTQAPQTTVVTKSATTVKVEACTAMQPGPERDQCAIRILTELMGPQR
jgi:hypothetical protein